MISEAGVFRPYPIIKIQTNNNIFTAIRVSHSLMFIFFKNIEITLQEIDCDMWKKELLKTVNFVLKNILQKTTLHISDYIEKEKWKKRKSIISLLGIIVFFPIVWRFNQCIDIT